MQANRDKKYCYGCFRVIEEGEKTCGVCGYTHDAMADSAQCLIPGTTIHDQYIIGKFLGQGGFGIQTAPAIAALLAAQLGAPSPDGAIGCVDPTPFAPSRFA